MMAGKKIKGRKRHIAVDVLGLLLGVMVCSAGTSDREGAKPLMPQVMAVCTGLKRLWADGGYTGKLVEWMASMLGIVLEIVKRPTKTFKIVQWRWIVERTFGWLNRYRRLSKDYERTCASSEAWIKISMINILVHRLKPG